jgi:ABC-type multidrug transport system permease subunit
MVNKKNSIMGPVISIFVMVLVISILAGLTFLFVSQLKDNVVETTITTGTATDTNVAALNSTPYTLEDADKLEFRNPSITSIIKALDGEEFLVTNATVTSSGVVTNASTAIVHELNITYTYEFISERSAYDSVEGTENAGATVVGYLPLIFLALIFGAILTLVLRIILPYINLGNQMGGF